MSKTYLTDINLTKNQLIQARIENLAIEPTAPVTGQIYFDTVSNKLRYYSGAVLGWISIDNENDARPPRSHVIATNTGLGLQHTISGAADGMVLRATGATTASMAVLAHGDLSGIGSNTHAAIDTHIQTANIHRELNDNQTTATNLWSATKINTLISALQSEVTGALVFKGGYDATTNTPNLTNPAAGTILQGFTYVITNAGALLGEALQVGDMIIAQQNNPSTLAHWTMVNKNIPDIVDATTTVKGIVALATSAEASTGTNTAKTITPAGLKYTLDQRPATAAISGLIKLATGAEAIAGTDTQKAITPATLKSALGVAGTLGVARKFSQTLATSATSYSIIHGLDTTDVIVSVKSTTAPSHQVEVDVSVPSATTVNIGFNVAPAAGAFSVTIIG